VKAPSCHLNCEISAILLLTALLLQPDLQCQTAWDNQLADKDKAGLHLFGMKFTQEKAREKRRYHFASMRAREHNLHAHSSVTWSHEIMHNLHAHSSVTWSHEIMDNQHA
jgi:hypothetical protein